MSPSASDNTKVCTMKKRDVYVNDRALARMAKAWLNNE